MMETLMIHILISPRFNYDAYNDRDSIHKLMIANLHGVQPMPMLLTGKTVKFHNNPHMNTRVVDCGHLTFLQKHNHIPRMIHYLENGMHIHHPNPKIIN